MRTVGIRELRKGLSRELEDLPFYISSKGKIIAVVERYRGSGLPVEQAGIKSTAGATPALSTKIPPPPPRDGSTELCKKHPGSMKMTCGCS